MFEGNEVEGKIGSVGSYSADVTSDLKLKITLGVEVDLIAEAKKLAAKTSTPVDDAAIAWLEKITQAAKAQPV